MTITMSDDSDLVTTSLFCASCKRQHEVALPGDAILRRVLATLACPSCETIGVLRLARKATSGAVYGPSEARARR